MIKKLGMEARRNIAYMLFVISLMLLVIPVMPHHHHADGHLCLKNDISVNCCTHHYTSACEDAGHGCDADCIATHFFEQISGTDKQYTDFLAVPQMTILFYDQLSALLLPLESIGKGDAFVYLERLHDALFVRISGLRAPPYCA